MLLQHLGRTLKELLKVINESLVMKVKVVLVLGAKMVLRYQIGSFLEAL